MPADTVLSVRNVYKKFRRGEIYTSLRDLLPALTRRAVRGAEELDEREFWALKDVSFDVARGEALGVIGHNGAGKSTLLKHLCGIMKPTRGSIVVKGRLSALIEVGAGFHPDLTGRENIYLNGTILGMSRAEIRRKFDAIVDFSGLAEFIDTPVKRYSSGMYARLGFSVAAHVEPDVLIIDEVLSVGDYVFRRKGVEKMRAVLQSGTTVVFVSHNLRAVSSLCQRAVLMERGRVMADGRAGEVIGAYLDRNARDAPSKEDKDAWISRVTLRDSRGAETIQFDTGGEMFVDVEVTGRKRCERLAVVLSLSDEEHYELFNTSTQRLGHDPCDVDAGTSFVATFQLRLHVAPGTYHVDLYVHDYSIDRAYDAAIQVRTFYVASDRDIRGVVDLEPRVTQRRGSLAPSGAAL